MKVLVQFILHLRLALDLILEVTDSNAEVTNISVKEVGQDWMFRYWMECRPS